MPGDNTAEVEVQLFQNGRMIGWFSGETHTYIYMYIYIQLAPWARRRGMQRKMTTDYG